ncbi:MAG: GntR family transcriptional regulator, partial [Lachnospiraceae bacterium]|nr:GntR family transcriptional regulator [Lachnospiraceae bacterium]
MKGELVLNSNDYLPLRDVVFQTLRQSILTGQMEPGERLMEVQLAEELGVSRTPVREAIRMLELEGLVVMIPRRGAQVAAITEQDLRDVLEVRATLERLAVRLACERFTEEGYRNLEKANREFAHLARLKNKSVVDITNADVHFHDVIYQATGNRRLIQIVQNLQEQMYR